MSDTRRDFLGLLWRTGLALVAAAGVWTSWDILRPRASSGFGGKFRDGSPAEIPGDAVKTIAAAQTHLTKIDNEVVALWWRCPHLGCRVPFCESSGRFECPCHGSVFNRAGDYLEGPAPRGLDRFAVEVDGNAVVVDTGSVTRGKPPGTKTIDEPARGPSCAGGGS